MSYYLAEIRLNRNKRDTSEKKGKKKKRLILSLFTLAMISFLISASVMLFSVTACVAPEILCVMRTPENPNYDQQIKITANVIKGSGDIATVILRHQLGSGNWINVTMNLQEGLYVATIPAQPYNTTVNYKVFSSDTAGRSDISELYSYIVGDFVPPVISNVNHIPDSPNPYEYVKVSANVTEPADASGIKKAALWFTAAGRWSSITMTLDGGLWAGVIPGLRGRFYVRYYVQVFDNAGNSAKSPIFSYSVTVTNIKPVAIISKSANNVYTGEIIDFSASASYDPDGSIVSYDWDFGDGKSDSVAVSHSYVVDGLYTVILKVVDDDGASDRTTALITVKNRPPVADINTSTTILDKEETVVFDASESYDLDGTIVSYSWDFGDGTKAAGVTTSYSYSATGEYTVTLTVTDDDGATDTTTVTKTVRNQSPVAAFTESAHTLDTNEVISFDASASYDPDGTIVNFFWDFGDGTTGTGVSMEHSYPENGLYTVTLTVTDDDSATDSTTATKRVLNQSPVASFTESAHTVETRELIIFDASASYDPDSSIVSYDWDFGDGNGAAGIIVTHTYANDGSYIVTLIVTDDDGATDLAQDTKTVVNKPPIAIFTESAHRVDTSEVISFDASYSYDLDGTIVSYSWDFGDGTTATGVEVDHGYTDDGTYTVILTVTDDDGATDNDEDTKTVDNLPPVASFTESAHTVDTSDVIYFDASDSYDVDGKIVTYEWEFGDGATASGVEVEHAYTDDRAYTVTLIVTDDDGGTDAAYGTKTVINRIPVASFTESAHTVHPDEIIHFDASESYDVDGTIIRYEWDFGDGKLGTGITTEHAYREAGNYTVTLTVTDNDRTSASTTDTKTVKSGEDVEIQIALSLSVLLLIILGVTALTATILYGLFIRRKQKQP
ncbi:MAG: PKD domain-containing protein [Candidatus Bathyarchaeota archaeon]|nr:PKD domain-containing protein [Candidatus Bathyarchaeum sp.]